MILIVGGAASGKREYAISLGYGEANMADGVLDSRPVIYNLQALVAREASRADELIPYLLKKEVVICDEVGSGVIPTDRAEREGREQTGRLLIKLAQNADAVVRLVCGIPTVIKGSI